MHKLFRCAAENRHSKRGQWFPSVRFIYNSKFSDFNFYLFGLLFILGICRFHLGRGLRINSKKKMRRRRNVQLVIRIYRCDLSFGYRLVEVNILICFDQRARTRFVRRSKDDCQLSQWYLHYCVCRHIILWSHKVNSEYAVLIFNKTVVMFLNNIWWQSDIIDKQSGTLIEINSLRGQWSSHRQTDEFLRNCDQN